MAIKKRVIVTGATGFVGANLSRLLLRKGHEVHLLVRPAYLPWRIREIRAHVHLHIAPLENRASIDTVVRRVKPDWLFHLAAYGAYPSQTNIRQMVNTNILGWLNLLQVAVRVGFESLVNVGSSSEYGFKSHAPKETESILPNSDYAITKAAATFWAKLTAREHKVYIPTLRLYSAFGPYEEPSRLMPTLVWYAREGRLPALGDPTVARDFVYVEDVCRALLLAAQKRSTNDLAPIYNVGTGKQTRLRQLVREVRHLFGVREAPRWSALQKRRWDTSHWVADAHKIGRELGWKPRYSLRQGLQRMYDWFEDPRWQEYYQKFYDLT